MSEIDKTIISVVATFLGVIFTYLFTTLLKLIKEFEAHRAGKGHAQSIDYLTTVERKFEEEISASKQRIILNTNNISHLSTEVTKLTSTTKYRFRGNTDRLDLMEAIMRDKGITFFDHLPSRMPPDINKDTFDGINENKDEN